MVQGEREVGRSEGPVVTAGIGPPGAGIPSPKGRRHPTGLDGKETQASPIALETLDGEHLH